MKRRQFLKLMGIVGTASVATGYGVNAKGSEPPTSFPEAKKVKGIKPEAFIDPVSGEVKVDSSIVMRHSSCLGCYSSCGNRVKIDRSTGKILGVFGNPYNPANTLNPLPFDASLEEAYRSFGRYKDKGIASRSTLCAKGNATVEVHNDPMRILVPLKRAGGRGEGKWKPISWDDVVNETVEGGQIFKDIGEDREVEGFRQVRDLETLIDPKQPELGPKANQFLMFGGRNDGRAGLRARFIGSFGTLNFHSHGFT